MLGLDQLAPGEPVRISGIRADHLDAIAALQGLWAPILISRDHRIIDGHYRFMAARRQGQSHIACEYFDGDQDAAYVEAVRRNAAHGLPLTTKERLRAASCIVRRFPEWSDRRIGRLAGISHATVARLRWAAARPTGSRDHLDNSVSRTPGEARIGDDGKAHPVDKEAVQARIVAVLREHPQASLREIARLAGSSPETARAVRRRQVAKVPCDGEPAERASAPVSPPVSSPALPAPGPPSPPVSSTPFEEWFRGTRVDADCMAYVSSIPISQLQRVAEEAGARAERWQAFSRAVEARAGHDAAPETPSTAGPE
jgi:ParB-like chromosome segregation protein Spo0J